MQMQTHLVLRHPTLQASPTQAARCRNTRGGWMARNRSRVLTDHDEIRRWAEERDASPACVRRTGGNGDIGMIRLDFPGYSGEQSLEHIDWDEWFQKFDESSLALLVQDQLAGGGQSNFNKLIGRETAERRAEGNYRASRHEGRGNRSSSRAGASGAGRTRAGTSSGSRSRSATSSSKRASASQRSSSQRAKRNAGRSESAARTTRAGSSRTKSSGASSGRREPGRAVSRSKSQRGSQSARGDVTRRSGTVAGRNRGRATAGGRQAAASSSGRRSAKSNPRKVVKAARRIRQGADNIIRMERGQGSRGPSRATKRTSAKAVSGTARQSRSRNNARSRRRAA